MRKTIFRKLRSQGLIENYNRFRKNLPPRLPKKIFIWDETLREGELTPRVFLTYVEKVKLTKMLDDMGVAVINLGFPGLSDEEKKTVRRLSNESFQQARLVASAHTLRSDVDDCLGSGIHEISISSPINKLNLQYVSRTTKEQALKDIVDSVGYAKGHGLNVNFVLQDASRTPIQEILEVFEAAVNAGADQLVIADTVGFLRPLSTRYLISNVRKGLSELLKKDVSLSVKCHNDFGLATANTLAAVEEGITYPQTCIAGYGERAGIAPMEEVVLSLELLYGLNTGIDVKKLYRIGQLAEKSFAWPLPFHKPIVGEDAFSHASDSHIHAMLSHPLTYEPFLPEMIARQTLFYLGVHTGEQIVEDRLRMAGIKATPAQINEIVKRVRSSQENLDKGQMLMIFYQVKSLLREMRKGLTEEDFWEIVKKVTKQKPKPQKPS